MTRDPATLDRWAPATVAFVGLMVAAMAFGLDLLGGVPGFGRVQYVLLGAGVLIILAAGALLLPRGQAWLASVPRPRATPDTLGVLWLALAFSAVAGLADPGIVHLQNLLSHRFAYVSPHMTWMSPLSYAVLLILFASPLLLLGHGTMGWLRSRRTAATLFTFLTLGSLLLLYHPEVHFLAGLLVALGIAAQVWRTSASDDAKALRTASKMAVPAFVGIALVVGAQLVAPSVSEWRAKRGFQAGTGAQNVVVIILDTVRAANLELYGYDRATMPKLTERARNGVVFERGIATSAFSLPSHASVVTGLYPHDTEANWQAPLEQHHVRISEILEERGYLSGGFFANRGFGGRNVGLQQGFHHWDAEVVTPLEIFGASHLGRMFLEPRKRLRNSLGNWNQFSVKHGDKVTDEFLDWVGTTDGRPFFGFLNYFDAHAPYEVPEAYRGTFDGVALPPGPERPANALRLLDRYDALIKLLDDEMERIFVGLEQMGVLDDTWVIVTSDHGEEFMENGYVGHGRGLTMWIAHVPMIVIPPQPFEGAGRVPEFVSIRDIPATVLDITGGFTPGEIPGRSLAGHWNGAHHAVARDHAAEDSLSETDPSHGGVRDGVPARISDHLVLSELIHRDWSDTIGTAEGANLISAFAGDFHFGRWAEDGEKLFNVAQDPWELEDLSADSTYAVLVEMFRMATDSIASDFDDRSGRAR